MSILHPTTRRAAVQLVAGGGIPELSAAQLKQVAGGRVSPAGILLSERVRVSPAGILLSEDSVGAKPMGILLSE